MKKTKNIIITLSLLLSFNAMAQVTEERKLIWHTDMMKAEQISVSTGKPLFAFFTGSDWCLWCKKMQRDVFLKEEFIQWAENNVVLVELDFPRNKSQDSLLVKQNHAMQQLFQVRGYPTVWLFFLNQNSKEGTVVIERLGELGYPAGARGEGKEHRFIEEAERIIRSRNIK